MNKARKAARRIQKALSILGMLATFMMPVLGTLRAVDAVDEKTKHWPVLKGGSAMMATVILSLIVQLIVWGAILQWAARQ